MSNSAGAILAIAAGIMLGIAVLNGSAGTFIDTMQAKQKGQ